MKIRLKFFASLKETLQTSGFELELPMEVKTIGELRRFLTTRDPIFAEAFAPNKNLRAAQSQIMVLEDALVQDHAEVAFFPPVTGG